MWFRIAGVFEPHSIARAGFVRSTCTRRWCFG